MNALRLLPAALALALLCPRPAPAADAVRDGLEALARDVRSVLKDRPVKVGVFSPLEDGSSDVGPGIERVLRAELLRLSKDAVSDRADFVVAGRFGVYKGKGKDGGEVRFARISVSIYDRLGKVLKEIDGVDATLEPVRVADGKSMGILGGGSGAAPPGKFDGYDAVKNPTFFLDGDKVLARKGGLLAVEVRVKPRVGAAAKPARPSLDGKTKQAFVDIPLRSLYEVAVTNNADFHAGVTLTIDGLDVFEFTLDRAENDRPKYTHHVIPPRSTVVIKGWHHTSDPGREDNVLSFLVTEYGKGAGSARKARGKVGLLTVTLAAAWGSERDRPDDEVQRLTRSGKETTTGPALSRKFKEVSMSIGQVREVVTVRYSR